MTGTTIYQERVPGWFSMSPLVIVDLLLMVNQKGMCTLVKTGPEFKIVAESDLSEPVLATPAILDGRIYFRTAGHIICVDSP